MKKTTEKGGATQKLFRGLHLAKHTLSVWSVITFLVVAIDFATGNKLSGIVTPTVMLYAAGVIVFGLEKEFKRWKESHQSIYRGDMWIFIFSALIILILLIDSIARLPYSLPHEIIISYFLIVIVFHFTNKLKGLFENNGKSLSVKKPRKRVS